MTTSAPPRQPALGFIFVTLVLAIVGFGILVPVLPQLLVQFRHGGEADGSRAFGWIVSVYALMQFVGSPILGSLSDRFGRRKIILIATAGSAIDYLIMANTTSLSWFFVARTIAGVTAGVFATANAYIADVTPPEKRAGAYGLLGAAFGLGFIIGPVLGGFLGTYSLKLPFWFAAGCSILNWTYGFFVLPESLAPENRRPFSWKRANPIGALLNLKRFPAVLGLVESYFILMLSQLLLQATWTLYTQHRYHWKTMEVGLSLGFAGVAMAFVQAVVVRKLVPQLGETRAVALGFCISIVAQVCYGLATSGWMIYAIICFGAFAGVSGPALQSYITRHVPANEQGAVQGVFSGLQSLAGIPGPFIATHSFAWAISQTGFWNMPGIAFFEAAILLVLSLLLALRAFRRSDRAAQAAPA